MVGHPDERSKGSVESALPGALEALSNSIDEFTQLLDRGLAKIAGLDPVPGRQGLSPLPSLGT